MHLLDKLTSPAPARPVVGMNDESRRIFAMHCYNAGRRGDRESFYAPLHRTAYEAGLNGLPFPWPEGTPLPAPE